MRTPPGAPGHPRRPRRNWVIAGLVAGLAASLGLALPAWGQRVALAGSMGTGRALLVIDGQPQVLAVGASARGVTLLRLDDGQAQVRVAGHALLLRLGATPVQWQPEAALPPGPPSSGVASATPSAGGTIVLPMGPGGHFMASGSINGRSVQFMVDTGATTIALSQADANRIGLDWKRGRPLLSQTAGGTVPVHAITLDAVRIGSATVANVAAVVVPSDMPAVLLGNSFLNRFTLRRDSDTMRLELKP